MVVSTRGDKELIILRHLLRLICLTARGVKSRTGPQYALIDTHCLQQIQRILRRYFSRCLNPDGQSTFVNKRLLWSLNYKLPYRNTSLADENLQGLTTFRPKHGRYGLDDEVSEENSILQVQRMYMTCVDVFSTSGSTMSTVILIGYSGILNVLFRMMEACRTRFNFGPSGDN